jgi:hypothetical protein
MKARRSLTVGALALCLLLGLFLSRPSAGQPVAAPPAAAGRYQVLVKGTDTSSTVFVFDSMTGQCWHRSTHPNAKEWSDMGTPAK